MFAQFGSALLAGLRGTEYFVPANQGNESEKISEKGPTNKVGSWSQSMWLLDQEPFEIRIAQLYDLETEFETIQDKSYELMDTFQMHWAIRGVATYLMTIEIMDLFYIKL